MPTPQLADIFLIPLLNGDFAVGQVVETATTPSNTALCALTLLKSAPDWPPSAIHHSEVISLILIQDTALSDETWQVIGFEAVPALERIADLSDARSAGFSNMTQHDPALIEAFVNACHGHYPWDGFPDPQFFNSLLINPKVRPKAARMKSQFTQ